jgi:uncharacterized protein (TIGR03437 family)
MRQANSILLWVLWWSSHASFLTNGQVYAQALYARGGVSVVDAGGFQPGPVAPGSLVAIFGSGLAPEAILAFRAPWPKVLSNTSVLVNGVAAPVAFVSPTQINAQVPYETKSGQAAVTVVAGSRVLPPVAVTVQPIAPGLFVDSQHHVLAQNQDGTLNSAVHPAAPETLLTVYLTGQGTLSTPIADGAAAPAGYLIIPEGFVAATIGGQSVAVLGVSMSTKLVGVLEVTIATPSLGPGEKLLSVGINGALSNAGFVTLGVN